MKRIKLLVLMLILLLTSGCSVDYTLKVNGDKVVENISATYPKKDNTKEKVAETYNNYSAAFIDTIDNKTYNYNKNMYTGFKNYYLRYNYTYDVEDLYKSRAINECVSEAWSIKTKDVIRFKTGKGFNCLYFYDTKLIDNINIKIKTYNKVLSNNADEIKGNTYIWKINTDNYENKSIDITMKHEKAKNFTLLYIGIAIAIIAVLTGIIYIFIKIRNKRVNKI